MKNTLDIMGGLKNEDGQFIGNTKNAEEPKQDSLDSRVPVPKMS